MRGTFPVCCRGYIPRGSWPLCCGCCGTGDACCIAGTVPVLPPMRGELPGATGAIGCAGVWIFCGMVGIDGGGCVPVDERPWCCPVGDGVPFGGPYGGA
jgi:hypothetical protein